MQSFKFLNFFLNYVVKNESLILEHHLDIENHSSSFYKLIIIYFITVFTLSLINLAIVRLIMGTCMCRVHKDHFFHFYHYMSLPPNHTL